MAGVKTEHGNRICVCILHEILRNLRIHFGFCFGMHDLWRFSVAHNRLYVLFSGQAAGKFHNFRSRTIAFIQMDAMNVFSENFRQKRKDVLRLFRNRLYLVAQNRHWAVKHFFQQNILQIGIILHFINHKMFDLRLFRRDEKRILQVQQRINVFIAKNAVRCIKRHASRFG